MKTAFIVVPTALAALVFAAHCLHADGLLFLPFCLAFPFLLLAWRPWAIRFVQFCLLLASIEWVRTTFSLASQRLENHQPFLRLIIILSSVALFTLASAFLLQLLPPLRRRPLFPGPTLA